MFNKKSEYAQNKPGNGGNFRHTVWKDGRERHCYAPAFCSGHSCRSGLAYHSGAGVVHPSHADETESHLVTDGVKK